MGKGISASELDDETKQVLDNMKDQLLIVLINRLGGDANIPVTEIDDTGQYLCSMKIDNDPATRGQSLHFVVSKKS